MFPQLLTRWIIENGKPSRSGNERAAAQRILVSMPISVRSENRARRVDGSRFGTMLRISTRDRVMSSCSSIRTGGLKIFRVCVIVDQVLNGLRRTPQALKKTGSPGCTVWLRPIVISDDHVVYDQIHNVYRLLDVERRLPQQRAATARRCTIYPVYAEPAAI